MAARHPLFLIREGQLVRFDGPRRWTPLTRSSAEAVKAITSAKGEGIAPYVYDVDGVEARAGQFSFYQMLEQAHAAPWIHSGCRTPEDAMDTFFAGAEAITIDAAQMDETILTELSGIADGEIHLAVRVQPRMDRPRELARLATKHALAGIVLQVDAATDPKVLGAVASELRTLGVSTTLLALVPFEVDADLESRVDRICAPESGVQ